MKAKVMRTMTKESPLKNGAEPHPLTVEEQREGGKKSGAVRRKKKLLKDLIEQFGTLGVQNPKLKAQMAQFGIDPDEMTNDMATVVGQYMKAMKGDTSAFNSLRDTKGEKPVDKSENKIIAPKPLIDLTDRKKNGE